MLLVRTRVLNGCSLLQQLFSSLAVRSHLSRLWLARMRLRTLARFASRYIMAGIEDVAVAENLAEVRSRIQKAVSVILRPASMNLFSVFSGLRKTRCPSTCCC